MRIPTIDAITTAGITCENRVCWCGPLWLWYSGRWRVLDNRFVRTLWTHTWDTQSRRSLFPEAQGINLTIKRKTKGSIAETLNVDQAPENRPRILLSLYNLFWKTTDFIWVGGGAPVSVDQHNWHAEWLHQVTAGCEIGIKKRSDKARWAERKVLEEVVSIKLGLQWGGFLTSSERRWQGIFVPCQVNLEYSPKLQKWRKRWFLFGGIPSKFPVC